MFKRLSVHRSIALSRCEAQCCVEAAGRAFTADFSSENMISNITGHCTDSFLVWSLSARVKRTNLITDCDSKHL